MELDKNPSEESFNKFTNKELVGNGSNGNRVYKVLNKIDNKVTNFFITILDIRDEEDTNKQIR